MKIDFDRDYCYTDIVIHHFFFRFPFPYRGFVHEAQLFQLVSSGKCDWDLIREQRGRGPANASGGAGRKPARGRWSEEA